jgi:hypothetical protein
MKTKTIFLLLISLLFSCSWENVFTDETYQESIKQDIGGQLIRNIHNVNDFHSFQYDIEYFYKKSDSDSACKIGSGLYYGKEPPENEQILKLKNWLVFKTSGDREKDRLFISNDTSEIWIEYEISPQTIESTALWMQLNINSSIENWDSVSKISNIDNDGYVTAWYIYAKKNRIFSFQTGKRKIVYRIDFQTGQLKIIEVSKK